jgi:hypothetical protein
VIKPKLEDRIINLAEKRKEKELKRSHKNSLDES